MSAIRKGLTLRHLAFTGPGVKKAELVFAHGLNVVYGASNTGKSSAARALDFMLGSSRAPRESQEGKGYVAGWLGLTLPDGRDVTLYRALTGGNLRLYAGLVTEGSASAATELKAKHKHESDGNVSMFLLNAIGMGVKWVVRNSETGAKGTVTFRMLAPAVIVEEGAMFDERSPILTGQFTTKTAERNVFKVLMTGTDDEAIPSSADPKEMKTFNRGRVETLYELIAQADAELGEAGADREALYRQADALQRTLAQRTETLRGRQAELDEAVTGRREKLDAIEAMTATLNELRLTVRRYDDLDAVYRSDLARLESLEENSFLLKTIHGRECPTCGAPAHVHAHGLSAENIERFHRAAVAEMRKIQRERTQLLTVRDGLEAEGEGKAKIIQILAGAVEALDRTIAGLRIAEATARSEHASFLETLEKVRHLTDTFALRDQYEARKSQLQSRSADKGEAQVLKVGIGGVPADEFAAVVQSVLHEWGFPNAPRVGWHDKADDIRLDGKDRAANGKGVRAVLHAAFKVAMMIHCHDRGLPHPGFIVLDTPLLTYREPMDVTRHGELTDDEAALKATNLNERFYRHLASIADIGQVIVLENSDPPVDIGDYAAVTVFTARRAPGQRYGLFPLGN